MLWMYVIFFLQSFVCIFQQWVTTIDSWIHLLLNQGSGQFNFCLCVFRFSVHLQTIWKRKQALDSGINVVTGRIKAVRYYEWQGVCKFSPFNEFLYIELSSLPKKKFSSKKVSWFLESIFFNFFREIEMMPKCLQSTKGASGFEFQTGGWGVIHKPLKKFTTWAKTCKGSTDRKSVV